MKKIVPSLILIILILKASEVLAQQSKTDSLLKILKTEKEDTNKVYTLNELSEKLWQTGAYDEAKKYANDALTLSNSLMIGKEQGWAKGQANAYQNIGQINAYQGNFPEALKNHSVSLSIREKSGDKRGMAKSYQSIGTVYGMQGDYSEAVKAVFASLKISNEIGDKQGIAKSYNTLGHVYFAQSNYPEALKNYLASLKIKEEIGDKRAIAESYSGIALTYQSQGNYTAALKNQLAALKINEEIGNKRAIAACYDNIGSLYEEQGNHSESLKNHFAALKIDEEIGHKQGIASCYANIGNTYQQLGNLSEALKYHLASLKLDEEIGDKRGAAACYFNIAAVYTDQGKYQDALRNYFACLKIEEEIGNKNGISMSYNGIGLIYIKQKKINDAVHYLNMALSLAKEISAIAVIRESYYELSKAFAEVNNYQKAYEYHRLYSDVKDTLLNNENIKQIAQMKEQYESDKKDQQITLLNKDNELQTQKAKQQRIIKNFTIAGAIGITALLALLFYQFYRRRETKNKLAINQLHSKVLRSQLNPHFIFNALNSIKNFIQQHPDVADNYLTKFSILMRQVLENSEEEKITLSEEIAMIENYMQLESLRLPLGFDYEVSLDPSIDAGNIMVPPLILQPMIENAIWHGLKPLKHRGKISLLFSERNGLLEAVIEDDGVGLGSTLVNTVSPEKKRSMGMQITRERIDLMNRKARVKGWLQQQLFERGSNVRLAIPV